MTLEHTDDEAAALLTALDGIIEGDRYPLSPRIRTLRAVRAQLRPDPVREPLPEPKRYAPPRAKRRRLKPRFARGHYFLPSTRHSLVGDRRESSSIC